jgi:hypothetical protein
MTKISLKISYKLKDVFSSFTWPEWIDATIIEPNKVVKEEIYTVLVLDKVTEG